MVGVGWGGWGGFDAAELGVSGLLVLGGGGVGWGTWCGWRKWAGLENRGRIGHRGCVRAVGLCGPGRWDGRALSAEVLGGDVVGWCGVRSGAIGGVGCVVLPGKGVVHFAAEGDFSLPLARRASLRRHILLGRVPAVRNWVSYYGGVGRTAQRSDR